MSPKGVLLDFEEALSEGFVRVFPSATILADFFHFVSLLFLSFCVCVYIFILKK